MSDHRRKSPTETESDAARIERAAMLSTRLMTQGQESSPELESWLEEHPRNREIWSQRQQLWQLLGEQSNSPGLLDLRALALREAHRASRRNWRARPMRRWLVAAGLASIALLAGLLWFPSADVYRTAHGERSVFTLSDGSQIQLDAMTEVSVDYSSSARELRLARGQARFEVAKDVMRPFSVLAGGKRVVATGTDFNVDLLGKELRVTLISGHVAVLGEEAPVELSAGEQLKVFPSGKRKILQVSATRTTAWQDGKLVFDDEPLSEIVTRVSRYSQEPVAVGDAATGELRMSGVFFAGDVRTFVATVEGYLGVRVERKDGGFVLMQGQTQ